MVTLGSNKRKRFSLRNLTRASFDSTYFTFHWNHFVMYNLFGFQWLRWIPIIMSFLPFIICRTWTLTRSIIVGISQLKFSNSVQSFKQLDLMRFVQDHILVIFSQNTYFFWLLTFIKFRIYYFAMLRITTQTRIEIRSRVNLHGRVFQLFYLLILIYFCLILTMVCDLYNSFIF